MINKKLLLQMYAEIVTLSHQYDRASVLITNKCSSAEHLGGELFREAILVKCYGGVVVHRMIFR